MRQIDLSQSHWYANDVLHGTTSGRRDHFLIFIFFTRDTQSGCSTKAPDWDVNQIRSFRVVASIAMTADKNR